MEVASQRTDLLRVLLADDDDANAFTLQCAINRLSQPCAFQRVGQRDLLPEKIENFHPEFLVAAGSFSAPGELKQIKRLTNGHPIICLVETQAQAEASFAAGATDCVLLARKHELGTCLEKHLAGNFREPHFRSPETPARAKVISKLDARFAEFDRRVGALLRKLAVTSQHEFNDLKRVLNLAYKTIREQAAQRCQEIRTKHQLRKQRSIIHSPRPLEQELSAPRFTPPAALVGSRIEPRETHRPAEKSQAATPDPRDESSDALRTLELSFKTLFHTSLDPMFLLDGLGSFLHVNPAACAMLGSAPAELLGKSLLDFVPLAEKPRASAMWEALLIEGQQKTELVLQSSRGESRDIFLSARANLWFGVHLLIARDQTEIKKLRHELTTLQPAL